MKLSPTRALAGVAAVSMLAWSPTAAADPGELDPSFSKDGKALVAFPNHTEHARAIAALGIGRRVVVATSVRKEPDGDPSTESPGRDVAVARLTAEGAYDKRFSGDGRVVIRIPGSDQFAAGAAVQPDGKVVVAATNEGGLLLARLTRRGSLDTGFSGDGLAEVPFEATEGKAGVAVAPDGSLIAAGSTEGSRIGTGDSDFAVAKLTPNGTLDSRFSGDGVETVDFTTDVAAGPSRDGARALAVRPDGRIVVGGFTLSADPYAQPEFALTRLATSGELDPSFGGDGTVAAGFGTFSGVRDLALTEDGRTVAVGNTGHPVAVRYEANGVLDSTFGGDGTANVSFGERDNAFAVRVQSDGKPILAGVERGRDGGDFAIMRLTAGGTPDRSFGVNGLASIDLLKRSQEHGGVPGAYDVASSIAIDAGGRIVAGGVAGGDAAVVRLLSGI